MIGVSQGDRLAGERLIADNNTGISPVVLNCPGHLLHSMDTNRRRMAFALDHGDLAVAVQYQIGTVVVGSRRLEYRNASFFEKSLDEILEFQAVVLNHEKPLLHMGMEIEKMELAAGIEPTTTALRMPGSAN